MRLWLFASYHIVATVFSFVELRPETIASLQSNQIREDRYHLLEDCWELEAAI